MKKNFKFVCTLFSETKQFKHKESRIEVNHTDKWLVDKWLIRVEFAKEKPPKISVTKLVYSFNLVSLSKILNLRFFLPFYIKNFKRLF